MLYLLVKSHLLFRFVHLVSVLLEPDDAAGLPAVPGSDPQPRPRARLLPARVREREEGVRVQVVPGRPAFPLQRPPGHHVRHVEVQGELHEGMQAGDRLHVSAPFLSIASRERRLKDTTIGIALPSAAAPFPKISKIRLHIIFIIFLLGLAVLYVSGRIGFQFPPLMLTEKTLPQLYCYSL